MLWMEWKGVFLDLCLFLTLFLNTIVMNDEKRSENFQYFLHQFAFIFFQLYLNSIRNWSWSQLNLDGNQFDLNSIEVACNVIWYFICMELNCPCTPPHQAFQRHQEHDLKHPSLVDLITTNKTKQNKQTTFLHR